MKQIGVTKKKGTKALKDRIHKHLKDRNDVITDDDIKNIKVGDDESDTPQELAEELTDAVKSRKQTSPWNVLSSDDK